jgi:ribosomal protein S18 acetylase RimI-like enzyme
MCRLARTADVDAVCETLALAFRTDPVWGPALEAPDGRIDHLAGYWRYFVEDPQAQDAVWMLDGAAAVAVWVPPGGQEMSEEKAERLAGFNRDVFGEAGAERLAELYGRFEDNHPQDEPHAYLSLLATHPDHRGRGIGQRLLAEDLRGWDGSGVPAYLESTNPGNDHRYERAGFRRLGGFTAVLDGAPITTMWRTPSTSGD